MSKAGQPQLEQRDQGPWGANRVAKALPARAVAADAGLPFGGFLLAAISKKLHELTCQILEDLHLAGYFDAIQGEKPSLARKPDPEALGILMKQFSVTEEQTLMVGDGDADMNVAKNADVRAIGVSYGVSTKERLGELGAACVLDGISTICSLMR